VEAPKHLFEIIPGLNAIQCYQGDSSGSVFGAVGTRQKGKHIFYVGKQVGFFLRVNGGVNLCS
jgi:hypothetical protein